MSPVDTGVEGRAWTRREVELVASVYLHMLRMQLMGQRPNKAEHNRQLQSMLPARSKASIEYKDCNISAVLVELGVPPLVGYRPLFNREQPRMFTLAGALDAYCRLDPVSYRAEVMARE